MRFKFFVCQDRGREKGDEKKFSPEKRNPLGSFAGIIISLGL